MQGTDYDERNPRNQGGDYDSNDTQKTHRMRLSIDIHSIKEANFKGLIYARYGSIPDLGKKKDVSS
jgi:hypothetical protein